MKKENKVYAVNVICDNCGNHTVKMEIKYGVPTEQVLNVLKCKVCGVIGSMYSIGGGG